MLLTQRDFVPNVTTDIATLLHFFYIFVVMMQDSTLTPWQLLPYHHKMAGNK